MHLLLLSSGKALGSLLGRLNSVISEEELDDELEEEVEEVDCCCRLAAVEWTPICVTSSKYQPLGRIDMS